MDKQLSEIHMFMYIYLMIFTNITEISQFIHVCIFILFNCIHFKNVIQIMFYKYHRTDFKLIASPRYTPSKKACFAVPAV